MADPLFSTSLWSFTTSWSTTASLFLILNLVIGTIAVISRFSSNNRPTTHEEIRPLARAPSLIDRVKSINLSFYKFSPEFETAQTTTDYVHDDTVQLDRVPSLLERVKSIKLSSLYRSEPETEFAGEDSIKLSSYKFSPGLETAETTTDCVHNDPAQLERVPSLLERVKSIKLSSLYRSEPETEFSGEKQHQDAGQVSGLEAAHHVRRSKSESKVASGERKEKAKERMKKSASERAMDEPEEKERESVEKRRPATVRLEKTVSFDGEEDGVDAKADDFINRFKQQLKLQRLDSLLRYRDMLKGKSNIIN